MRLKNSSPAAASSRLKKRRRRPPCFGFHVVVVAQLQEPRRFEGGRCDVTVRRYQFGGRDLCLPIFSMRGSLTRTQPVSGRVLPLIVVADIASAGFCCTSAMNGVSSAAASARARRMEQWSLAWLTFDSCFCGNGSLWSAGSAAAARGAYLAVSGRVFAGRNARGRTESSTSSQLHVDASWAE